METSAPWSGRLRQAGGSLLRSQQIGLVVVLPLIGHATWHAYKEIVIR